MSLGDPTRGGLWSYFPIPLVAPAVLLVVLILFTPVLFESGPPAPGSLAVQAELTVTTTGPGNLTQFYVHPVSSAVAYTSIAMRSASNFVWAGNCPTSGLNWSAWQNVSAWPTETLSLLASPVVVEANATYTEGGQRAIYAGIIAFDVGPDTLSYSACYGSTPGSGSVSVSATPFGLALQDWGSGGPP
jgi:hypothetical protein